MTQCPKCSNNDISVEYIKPKTVLKIGLIPFQDKFTKTLEEGRAKHIVSQCKTEHLVYTCNTCGYRQAEETLDNLYESNNKHGDYMQYKHEENDTKTYGPVFNDKISKT